MAGPLGRIKRKNRRHLTCHEVDSGQVPRNWSHGEFVFETSGGASQINLHRIANFFKTVLHGFHKPRHQSYRALQESTELWNSDGGPVTFLQNEVYDYPNCLLHMSGCYIAVLNSDCRASTGKPGGCGSTLYRAALPIR